MEQKIVVHMKKGAIHKGITHDFDPGIEMFHVLPAEGGGVPVRVKVNDMKALFWVRDYMGNRHFVARRDFAEVEKVERKAIVTFEDGEEIWGTLDSDPDDGLDTAGDGLLDEGPLVWIDDYGQPDQLRRILCHDVAEFLEGEAPGNLADDNGYGLQNERGFCVDCGSSLVQRPMDGDWFAVATGSLDSSEEFLPNEHCGIESQAPWLKIEDDLPRKTTGEAMGYEVEE